MLTSAVKMCFNIMYLDCKYVFTNKHFLYQTVMLINVLKGENFTI